MADTWEVGKCSICGEESKIFFIIEDLPYTNNKNSYLNRFLQRYHGSWSFNEVICHKCYRQLEKEMTLLYKYFRKKKKTEE